MQSMGGRSVDLRPRHGLPNVPAAPMRSRPSRRREYPSLCKLCFAHRIKDVQVLLGQSLLMWINALSQHTVLALFSKSDRCM